MLENIEQIQIESLGHPRREIGLSILDKNERNLDKLICKYRYLIMKVILSK